MDILKVLLLLFPRLLYADDIYALDIHLMSRSYVGIVRQEVNKGCYEAQSDGGKLEGGKQFLAFCISYGSNCFVS